MLVCGVLGMKGRIIRSLRTAIYKNAIFALFYAYFRMYFCPILCHFDAFLSVFEERRQITMYFIQKNDRQAWLSRVDADEIPVVGVYSLNPERAMISGTRLMPRILSASIHYTMSVLFPRLIFRALWMWHTCARKKKNVRPNWKRMNVRKHTREHIQRSVISAARQ